MTTPVEPSVRAGTMTTPAEPSVRAAAVIRRRPNG